MFVTKYEYYPIYEPAEGGYYYEGVEMVDSREFHNYRKAKQYINRLYRQAVKDEKTDSKYWCQTADNLFFGMSSAYIGEGWRVQFELKKGQAERGWKPYC